MMAVIVVRSKQSGAAVRYTVLDTWLPKLIDINKSFDPRGRYDAVMKADSLFEVAYICESCGTEIKRTVREK